MALHKKIDGLLAKASSLSAENKRLSSKNEELQQEISSLKTLLLTELKKSGELSDKIKMIKLAQHIGGGSADKNELTELKRKINEYIREVDNCLSMLNE